MAQPAAGTQGHRTLYTAFDWERWHELDVLRRGVAPRLEAKKSRAVDAITHHESVPGVADGSFAWSDPGPRNVGDPRQIPAGKIGGFRAAGL